MKVSLSGSSGLIGSALLEYYLKQGHEVAALTRGDFVKGVDHLSEIIKDSDVVVHLAGAPVVKRWTDFNKEQIWQSRIETTGVLVEAMKRSAPSVFLCASAVGIYQPYELSSEEQPSYGSGFLADVCKNWEMAANEANEFTRVVNLRLGVVLHPSRGALASVVVPFRWGLGGRVGNGKQPFPWIHVDDVVAAVDFLANSTLQGPVNLVSPGQVNSDGFSKCLASVLHRPAWFPVPVLVLRLLYGEGASALLATPFVKPGRLLENGFQFKFPNLNGALADLLKKKEDPV